MKGFLLICMVLIMALSLTTTASADIPEIKLIADDGEESDYFGYSVSISGDTALVGAYGDDGYKGSAYVFRYNDSIGWEQEAKLIADDGEEGDYFGASVSISGDTALVGAIGDDGYKGSAYVFRYNDSIGWEQEAKLTALDGIAGDYFGASVSISGDIALVGAYSDDGYEGSAYVFRYNDSIGWEQEAKLIALDGIAGDYFGASVSISGDTALVGAIGDDDKGDNSGSAYVFRYNGTIGWEQKQKLLAGDGDSYDNFGQSVSISGDTALVGADQDDGYKGSAYVFRYNDSIGWEQEAKLIALDGEAHDYFGHSVSISGGTALVGAIGDDGFKGSAYVFRHDSTGWVQEQKLILDDGESYDFFGHSVSISGGTALVGAYWDDGCKGSSYVTETPAANTPPEALDDAYTTNEDTTLNVDAPGVLGNDDDADSDPLTALKVTDPANGTLIFNGDGSFTYNPGPNFNGTDSFIYKANDNTADSNIATVSITVTAVNDPPVADAGGPYVVDEGSALTLDASGSIDPETPEPQFNWDFGDGTTGTGKQPEHVYTDDGVYTVTLTVTDEGDLTDTAKTTVTVSDLAPKAQFTWSPEPQAEGSAVEFTDASTSYPDSIVAWDWDFAGLGSSNEQNPSFIFLDDGTYTVKLAVTDDDGSTYAISHDVTITNLAPTVSISLDSVPYVGRPVSFTGSFEDPGALDPHTYTWNFGDGTPVVTGTLTPEHIFSALGIFDVTLTVTDDDDSTTVTLQVEVKHIIVQIDIKPGSCPNPLNLKSKGVLPAAILGTEDFDVTQVDLATVFFGPGTDPFDGGVPAEKTALEDVATPYDGELVDCPSCTEDGTDGFLDLTLKFPTPAIAVEIGEVEDGACIPMGVVGRLLDGTTFFGHDFIRIINKGQNGNGAQAAALSENGTSFVHCTGQPEFGQIKVAQVPIPWQFWGIETDPTTGVTTVIDRIRISRTWINPPNNQPPGEGLIFVNRQWAVAPSAITLEELVWDFEADQPAPNLNWQPVPNDPVLVIEGTDTELPIEITENGEVGAVLVAYEVLTESESGVLEVVSHFVNEAVLESRSPPAITKIMINFDIHNATDFCVTNFELDFLGMDFDCKDVEHAIGFVAASGIPPVPLIDKVDWGANEDNPLVVRPITVTFPDGTTQTGTEVKWIQPDRPLVNCDWLHVGLVLGCTGFDCFNVAEPAGPTVIAATVQGYWTELEPKVWCEEAVNPHGETVPPAGWSTLPGKKGGQNDEGFYQFGAYVPCHDDVTELMVEIEYTDVDGTKQTLVDAAGDIVQFAVGDVVKITEAPGKAAVLKKIGSTKGKAKAVDPHITLPSDPTLVLYCGGTELARCDCLVPPKPK